MKIIISNNGTPFYEQVKEALITAIITGDLKEDEILPSIRSLAKDLRISVLTIKKAYDELEKEGYIITKQGKGSFVSLQNLELIKELKQQEIEKYLTKIIEIAKLYNISEEEIIDLIKYLFRSDKNE